ncbi:MAG: putative quorum-sensing-regulated virulence factor [Halanaerobiales bacterium]
MGDVVEVTQKSNQILEKGEKNNLWPQDLNPQEKKQLAYISAQYGLDPFFGEMQVLGGNPYVTRSGLLRNAYEDENPPISIQLEKEASRSKRHFEYKAKLWKESTPADRPYIEYGEASPQDCNRMISKSDKDLKAMARTRATNRVLRLAYNVSITSAEELSGYDPDSGEIEDVTDSSPPPTPQGNGKQSSDDPGEMVLPFGKKHKGEKLKDIPSGYLEWLAENAYQEEYKEAAQAVLESKGNGEEGKKKKKKLSKRQEEMKKYTDADPDLKEHVLDYLDHKEVKGVDALEDEDYEELVDLMESMSIPEEVRDFEGG